MPAKATDTMSCLGSGQGSGMAISRHRDRERVEDEAAAWLVRLAEEPDDVELRARFEAWLAESDLNAEIWARTSRAYDLVGSVPPRHKDRWESHAANREAKLALPVARRSACAAPSAAGRPRRRPGRPTTRRLAVGIAAASLAACLIVTAMPGVLLRLEADIVTGTAELRSTVLEDGTRIHLAPESAIGVAFANGQRRVHLVKGDAFFEVAPDASRPFVVMAGDSVASVLGTAFEARRGEDDTIVAVQHGHVRVTDDNTSPPLSESLHAGDWVRVAWPGGVTRGRTRPDEIAAWVRGEFIARNRRVGEVVAALRRYYNGAILVTNRAFTERRVSGIYELRDPVRTLHELAASHGAVMRRVSPWLLIVTVE